MTRITSKQSTIVRRHSSCSCVSELACLVEEVLDGAATVHVCVAFVLLLRLPWRSMTKRVATRFVTIRVEYQR